MRSSFAPSSSFGPSEGGFASLSQRAARSSLHRQQQPDDRDDLNPTAVAQADDEFSRTFGAHGSSGIGRRQTTEDRPRTQQMRQSQHQQPQQQLVVLRDAVDTAATATTSFSGPPPTASLSSMLASGSSHARVAPTHSFDAYNTNNSAASAASTSPYPLSSSPLQAGVSPLISQAHFSSLLAAQEQFRYKHWMRDVHSWRGIAAAVWFAVVISMVLHTFQLSLVLELPSSLNPLDWVRSLMTSSPLLTQPLGAVWFVGLQVALLMVRAGQVSTNPAPLFQPFVPRVWRLLFDVPAMTTLALAVATTGLSGWCAMEILFSSSPLWNGVAADADSSDSSSNVTVTEQTSFIISGFLAYTVLHSCRLIFQHQSILTFPVVAHLSRSRLLLATLPVVLLDAAWFAAKFTLIYAGVIWTVIGSTIVRTMQSVEEVIEVDAATNATVGVSLFPGLASLYHLFLLLCCMGVVANLAQRFLSVFLTQYLDFENYFLHALYTNNGKTNGVQARDTSRSTSSDMPPNHLTLHLALQWLVELASNPAHVTRRNQFLFQDDMNRLFGSATTSMELSAQRSNVASTLPVQPAFVPVLVFALAQVRDLTDRLTAQRILVSSPACDEWDPNSLMAGGGLTPTTLSTAAFFATQLDGAGLFFPSRSQQTATLLANATQVNQCVQLLSFLAVHALDESGGSALSSTSGMSSVYSGPASQLPSSWLPSILSHLLALGLALDGYVHAPHFISPMQERRLQGHQITRSVCVLVSTVLDQALYRLVAAYTEYLPELRLAPAHTQRLQAYTVFTSK